MIHKSYKVLLSIMCRHRSFTRAYHKKPLTNVEVQTKRVTLFEQEVKRQAALITDLEKIQVDYKGQPQDYMLIMNKNMSTPYNCGQHIDSVILDRAVIAEVDGQIWDMHQPLESDCTLCYSHFKEADPYHVNKAFWRSASVMLGAVLETIFKDKYFVEHCSFPSPNVRTGSFVYDVDLKLENWNPTKDELRVLSGEMVKLAMAKHDFQRLKVDASVALKIFEDNRYKKSQIPHIAAKSEMGTTVVLYKVGNFIDLSRGPMISNTRHLGKCTITAVHPIETDYGKLFRVQGVALPSGLLLNHFSYSLIEDRGRTLNSGRIPSVATMLSFPPQKTGHVQQ